MAAKNIAKKTATKKTTTKKTTAKKTTAKKAEAKKATAKKTTSKKATAKKTTTKKVESKKATAKKTVSKKTTIQKAAKKAQETVAGPPVEAKAASKPKDGVSSTNVNIGHVFSLRPRVNTSYRPADFATAKQLLQDESYTNIQEATRAVVAKALELTHKGSPLVRSKPKRR